MVSLMTAGRRLITRCVSVLHVHPESRKPHIKAALQYKLRDEYMHWWGQQEEIQNVSFTKKRNKGKQTIFGCT